MTLPHNRLELFLWVIEKWYGHWYTWGGDDPSGFDCSGLVIEGLKSVGLLPRGGDWTADGLWREFFLGLPAATQTSLVDIPKAGTLCFWFNSEGKASHVAICINSESYIGAEGGGRHVKTIEDAIKANAYIKIRPLSSRPGAKYVHIW